MQATFALFNLTKHKTILMETFNHTLEVKASVKSPIEKVWDFWTAPKHITQWCTATPEWHTPRAENDLRVGGQFMSRMEAKDGSMGFDFAGTYDEIKLYDRITYTMEDGRKVEIEFEKAGEVVEIVERFQAENTNPLEMQQAGWQAIIDSFKNYTESN